MDRSLVDCCWWSNHGHAPLHTHAHAWTHSQVNWSVSICTSWRARGKVIAMLCYGDTSSGNWCGWCVCVCVVKGPIAACMLTLTLLAYQTCLPESLYFYLFFSCSLLSTQPTKTTACQAYFIISLQSFKQNKTFYPHSSHPSSRFSCLSHTDAIWNTSRQIKISLTEIGAPGLMLHMTHSTLSLSSSLWGKDCLYILQVYFHTFFFHSFTRSCRKTRHILTLFSVKWINCQHLYSLRADKRDSSGKTAVGQCKWTDLFQKC